METGVQKALERGADVQPLEGGGSSERSPLQAEEDDPTARDAPDAHTSGVILTRMKAEGVPPSA